MADLIKDGDILCVANIITLPSDLARGEEILFHCPEFVYTDKFKYQLDLGSGNQILDIEIYRVNTVMDSSGINSMVYALTK